MNTPIVEQEEDDMADFLARLEQTVVKKPAKRFSTIQRDETGNRIVHIVVPKVNKAKGDIAPPEFEITTFDLDPITKTQAKDDLDNSVASIKAKLDEETEKKNEHKREVECLKEYIRQLTTKPLDQANPNALLLLDSQQVVKSYEEDAVTAKETRDWMESTKEEAAKFMEEISSTYEQTSLLSKIENMAEMSANF